VPAFNQTAVARARACSASRFTTGDCTQRSKIVRSKESTMRRSRQGDLATREVNQELMAAKEVKP
jgi:hypothetical protein